MVPIEITGMGAAGGDWFILGENLLCGDTEWAAAGYGV